MAIPVYLACAPADAAPADALAAALGERGWAVRRAPDASGAALAQAVAETRAAIVLVTPGAESNETLRRELAAIFNNGRPLVAVLAHEPAAGGWLRGALDLGGAVRLDAGPHAIDAALKACIAGGRVVAMLNIKGGVGKTILAANLFAAAHLADKRAVSFIDLDPQHNLTQYFLPPAERNRLRNENATIYALLRAPADTPSARFVEMAAPLNRAKGKRPRFELIAGDERLFEFTLDNPDDRERALAWANFRRLVALLRARSDAVVIDANPCATFLTRLAVTAADHIVAPVRPETYSLTGLNMLEHVVRTVRGRPLRASEFSVLLNGVNDRTRSESAGDPDALTRAEISAAPFFGGALLAEAVPYAGALRATPADRYAANPINVTAMMRVGGRRVKESLAQAAAAILKRAAP